MPMPLPEELKFEDSYLSDPNSVIAADIDTSLDSYMASGHDVGDGITGQARDDIIVNTLDNINVELKSINDASEGEAHSQQRAHINFYHNEIVPIFEKAREQSRNKKAATDFEQNAGANMSFQRIRSYLHRRRKEKAERLLEDLKYDPARNIISGDDNLRKQLLDKSEKWNQQRKQYHDGKFRNTSDKFDFLAETYYALSRNKQAYRERMQPKEVSEYVGKYNDDSLTGYITQIVADPDVAPLTHDTIITHQNVDDGSLTGNSFKYQDGDFKHVKVHRTISMQAKPGEESNRIKVTYTRDQNGIGTFSAYRAKKKYGADGALIDDPDLDPNSRALTAQDMEDLLEINAKDKFGRYLYSADSARIMKANIGGIDAHALYLRSALVTDRDHTIGKFKLELSEKKMREESAVRSAIRRSAFFQHVNSKTIQHYAAYQYNRGEDTVQAQRQGLYDSIKPDPNNPNAVAQDPIIFGFVSSSNNPGEADGTITAGLQQGKTYDAIYNDILPLLPAMRADQKRIFTLCEYLLTDDDHPEAWKLARKIVEDIYDPDDTLLTTEGGRFKSRFHARVKRLPASGQLMRMGLLQELETDRSVHWYNVKDAFIPNSFNVVKEDISARRGNFLFDMGKGLLDGSLLSSSFSTLSTGFYDAEVYRTPKEEWTDFASLYAETAADASSNFGYQMAAITVPIIPQIIQAEAYKGKSHSSEENSWEKPGESGVFKSAMATDDFIMALFSIVEIMSSIKELMNISGKMDKDDENKTKLKMGITSNVLKIVHIVYNFISRMIALWGDVPMVGIDSIVEAIHSLIEGIMHCISANMSRLRHKVTVSAQEKMETALSHANDQTQADHDMGDAISRNTQSQFFMSMARSNAKREAFRSSFKAASSFMTTIAASVAAGTTLSKHGGAPIKWISKAIDLTGFIVDKAMGHYELKDNIEKILGNKELLGYHNFDGILKQETGIKNHHYLNDVARIFTAIDMHHMVKNTNPGDQGRMDLALGSAGALFSLGSGSDDQKLQKLQRLPLEKFLAVLGGPASDWRMVLKNAIF